MVTTAEASLLRGDDLSTVWDWYSRAVASRDCQPADRDSIRKQLKLLRSHLPERVHDQMSDIAS